MKKKLQNATVEIHTEEETREQDGDIIRFDGRQTLFLLEDGEVIYYKEYETEGQYKKIAQYMLDNYEFNNTLGELFKSQIEEESL